MGTNNDDNDLPEIDMAKVDQYIIAQINKTSDEFIHQISDKWVDLNNTYYHILPYVNHTSPCMWDNLSAEDKMRPMMLSCNCPKCAVWC